MRPHAYDSPEMDRLVDEVISGVGTEIEALQLPMLAGVVLGGGYGRGEGGVVLRQGEPPALSNDLDFYVVTKPDATGTDIAAIGDALRPISEKWTQKLGVDVDFCEAKTPWRLVHDQERLMIQELVHGYFDVAGLPGEQLFQEVARRAPEELPYTEALRQLMNRGAGLLLASEPGRKSAFVARNLNKCILGAGDARLIASGRYCWAAVDRAKRLDDPLYSKALDWKFRPQPEPVCTFAQARQAWLNAFDEVASRPAPPRSLYHALRWLVRRRTIGPLSTLGRPPILRILLQMHPIIRDNAPFPASLKQDWLRFQ